MTDPKEILSNYLKGKSVEKKTVTTEVKTKAETKPEVSTSNADSDFTKELIRQINKDAGDKIAFNLGTDDAPTIIKRWISTGSKQLDYIIANKANGGLPEGRIVEIQGQPGVGKSHVAYEIAKATQRLGGIVVYIDTENATSVENLKAIGVDVTKKFAFIQTACTEEIFKAAESTILKARAMTADIPVTIIWDSLAASSPKAELEGEYDANTIGLQARVLGKGLRKIVSTIANQKVLFVLLNQQRQNLSIMYGDKFTTPGGMSVPYASSVRIKISGGQQLKKTVDGKEQVIGIHVVAKTIKNKTARPFRETDFEIHFGKGIVEYEQIFDALREYCDKHKADLPFIENESVSVSGAGAWKTFTIFNKQTGEIIKEEKFYKSEFGEKVLYNPIYKKYVDAVMDATYILDANALVGLTDEEQQLQEE